MRIKRRFTISPSQCFSLLTNRLVQLWSVGLFMLLIIFISLIYWANCTTKTVHADSSVPTATLLTPNRGPISGGQTVTVSGAGFYKDLKFDYVQQSTSSASACGISVGKVYCWGKNNKGQLGNGDASGATQYSPVAVDTSGVLAGKTITEIAIAYSHTIALASDGTVYGWGDNNYGQLGSGDTSKANQYSPVAVNTSGVLAGKTITHISASTVSTYAMASDGTIYSWGYNGNGQLGNGDTSRTTRYSPVAVNMSGALSGKVITQVSAEYYFAIALASDGTVYGWGNNDYGQLGSGDTSKATQYSPVAVNTSGVLAGKTITHISTSHTATSHVSTYALASDGTVYGWGDNYYGQLGSGDTSKATQYSPVAVDTSGVLAGKTIIQISAGDVYSIALASDGTVYGWGANNYGQLGSGDTSKANQYSPVAVNTSGVLAGKTISQVFMGEYFTIALASDGSLYGWGYNHYGQLGNGDASGATQYSPVAVNTSGVLAGKTISQIVKTEDDEYNSSVFALASDGIAYSWGSNNYGKLGIGVSSASQYSPAAVSGIPVSLNVVLGGNSVNIHNETANTFQFTVPAHAAGLVDMSISSDAGSSTLADAYDYAVAPTIANIAPNSGSTAGGDTVTIFGNSFDSSDSVTFGNYKAKIVNVSTDQTTMTVITPASISDGAVDVTVTDSFSRQAIDPDGFTYVDTPFTATSLNPNSGPISGGQTVTVSGTGFYHSLKFDDISQDSGKYQYSETTCGISGGKVYCWGYNGDGELGNGDTSGTNQYSPVAVDTSGVLAGKTITQITSGDNFTVALTSDGTVYSWGNNYYGQLGNGDTSGTNQYSPVAVNTSGVLAGKTITKITTGDYYVIALASDGTVYGWGDNNYGQLGSGDTSKANQYSPVAVDTSGVLAGKTITKIFSSGDNFTIAQASDSTIYSWGYNGDGELGNGDTSGTNQYSPVAVDTSGVLAGKTITQISLNGYNDYVVVLASDGTVYGWGENRDGQLGSGDTSHNTQYSPVAVDMGGVLAGKTITEIASGDYYVIALDSDGKVYGWGENYFGELGSGDTSHNTQYSPVAVDMGGVLAGKTVTKIFTSGDDFTIALTSDGSLYGWGYNHYGQLGNGDTTNQYSPVAVEMNGVLAGKTITKILASGASFTIALASDGSLYSWGYNADGELGNGDTSGTNQYSPVAVMPISSLISLHGILGGNEVSVFNETANSFQFITPSHPQGIVNFIVSSPGYGSFDLTNSYTYVSSSSKTTITITGVAPSSGSNTGGSVVTITGAGLSSDDTVVFGGIPARIINVATDGSSMTVVTPAANTTGTVSIVAYNY